MLVVLAAGTSLAGRLKLPVVGDPFQRTLGWSDMAARTTAVLAEARARGEPYASVIADERAVTAALLYYMRNEPTPVKAWLSGPRPLDHYEMTRPFRSNDTPALLVSVRRDAERITSRFEHATSVAHEQVPAGLGTPREVHYFRLTGSRGG